MISRVIKRRRMRRASHITRLGRWYSILGLKGMKPLRRHALSGIDITFNVFRQLQIYLAWGMDVLLFCVFDPDTELTWWSHYVGDFELLRNRPRSFLHMELFTISIITVISIVTFPTDCFPFWNVLVPLVLFVVGDTIKLDFLLPFNKTDRNYSLGHWVHSLRNGVSAVMLLLHPGGRKWNCLNYRSKGSQLHECGRMWTLSTL
jgi:hypothetical protein